MCGRILSVFVPFLSVLSVRFVCFIRRFHVRQSLASVFIQSIDEISWSVFLYTQLITTKTKTLVMKTFLEEWVKVNDGKESKLCNNRIDGHCGCDALAMGWLLTPPPPLAGQQHLFINGLDNNSEMINVPNQE